ncbi:DUF397 domain-containing protein [Micromonospora soli]|uniref:DUF397 domain-containing protein n=1 Tax=unclassified Micromonospora TaxID=2617518 RepID=UPI00267188C9|nr:DUF397 domain-containing protein [Micromonospora sp. NBRC 110009]WKT98623.1 DUF397 domain-containing protein [Micromonospora sp. NBRC 110009]
MDLSRAVWRTSTRSGSSGNCVEVAAPAKLVMVRDSKQRQGPTLSFSHNDWTTFIQSIKAGSFDV